VFSTRDNYYIKENQIIVKHGLSTKFHIPINEISSWDKNFEMVYDVIRIYTNKNIYVLIEYNNELSRLLNCVVPEKRREQ
jgi:hypothetical protein